MFTLRTTSCSHAQSQWKAGLRPANAVNYCRRGHRGEGLANNPAQGAGRKRPAIDDGVCDHWAFFHAVARNLSGCMEPDFHQRTSPCHDLSELDSGPRTCADFWMDRDLHFGYRLLFHPQDDEPGCTAGGPLLDRLAALDLGRAATLGCRFLPSILARAAASFSFV